MRVEADDRVSVNRRAGGTTISLGEDTNKAAQFARSVPDFVLKGRFADVVQRDLRALERETAMAVARGQSWWRRLMSCAG